MPAPSSLPHLPEPSFEAPFKMHLPLPIDKHPTPISTLLKRLYASPM